MMLLVSVSLLAIASCGKDDDGDDNNTSEPSFETEVVIKADGTTSNGSVFSAIDDESFYLDYIKYTVTEDHLEVSGYDKNGLKGKARIVSSITYKHKAYEVTSLRYGAFWGCSSLSSITIPNSVTSMSAYIFRDCTSLSSVNIPNGITKIPYGIFYFCSSLTSITIPDSVIEIDSNAFYGCTGLTDVTIPNGVTDINPYAFGGCCRLTRITIPNSVTSIGAAAFKDCSGLIEITIPNSVKSLGEETFYGCASLKEIHCLITSPGDVSSLFSFHGETYRDATLYVPKGLLDAYKNSDWSLFENIEEE